MLLQDLSTSWDAKEAFFARGLDRSKLATKCISEHVIISQRDQAPLIIVELHCPGNVIVIGIPVISNMKQTTDLDAQKSCLQCYGE